MYNAHNIYNIYNDSNPLYNIVIGIRGQRKSHEVIQTGKKRTNRKQKTIVGNTRRENIM